MTTNFLLWLVLTIIGVRAVELVFRIIVELFRGK